MADYELLALNESVPRIQAPTANDRGILRGNLLVEGQISDAAGSIPSKINPLSRAVRVAMTAAASGSNGIQVLDNVQADFGKGNYTLVRRIFVASTRPSANQILSQKHDGTNGRIITLLTTGVIRHTINGTNYDSTTALPSASNVFLDLAIVVTRETSSAAGSVVFYNNGSRVGSSVTIAAGAPVSVDNAVSEYILGTSTTRVAGEVYNWLNYNRALSAAEVLSLSINGPASTDLGASQVLQNVNTCVNRPDGLGYNTFDGASATGFHAVNVSGTGIGGTADEISVSAFGSLLITFDLDLTSGSLPVISIRETINSNGSISSALSCVNGSNSIVLVSGVTTTACVQWANTTASEFTVSNLAVRRIGITAQYNAQDAQSDTGQVLDSSGNKNHALLPASGATVIGRPRAMPQQVRWTNTWSGTNELQYIGGVNQNILPARAYIESIVGVITGTTVEDIIIGDGSDTDRYVTLTTGLAAGTVTFTLANRTTDGTNLKLTVAPDANATMSIAWTITYRTLE